MKMNLEKVLLIVIVFLLLVNTCTTMRSSDKQTYMAVKSLKKEIDSLEKTINISNEKLKSDLSDEIEMILIIENEIDGKSKKSHEIKEIIKNYK